MARGRCIIVLSGRVPKCCFSRRLLGNHRRLPEVFDGFTGFSKPKYNLLPIKFNGGRPFRKNVFRVAKAKGRAERLVSESGLLNWYVFRPGYINPGRTPSRAGFSGWLTKPFYALFPMIGIDASDLGKVLVQVGLG